MSEQAKTPLISIVLPTWNCADLLNIAIKSVIKQTYTNWELIIVNNFSTDHTNEVINSFNDHRIRKVDFKNNGVIAASRNFGIEQSAGAFIAFLDSDDFWYESKLEKCLHFLQDEGADLVCHSEKHFIEGGGKNTEWDVHYGTRQAITFESLLYEGNFLSTSAVIVKKEFLNKVNNFSDDAKVITAEDYDLWLKLMYSGAQVKMKHEVLGAYRIHNASASASLKRHLRAVREVVARHHSTCNGSNKKYHLRHFRIVASSCKALLLKGKSPQHALQFLIESLKFLKPKHQT